MIISGSNNNSNNNGNNNNNNNSSSNASNSRTSQKHAVGAENFAFADLLDQDVYGEAVNRVGVGGSMYRTKSLSSLIASNGYTPGAANNSSPTRPQQNKTGTVYRFEAHYNGGGGGGGKGAKGSRGVGGGGLGGAGVGPGVLSRAHSGSMPDLPTGKSRSESKADDVLPSRALAASPSRWEYTGGEPSAGGAHALFMHGIVGKTIRKDGEGAEEDSMAPEGRTLVTTAHHAARHARRPTRPSTRRSSLGLRDRGPMDYSSPATASGGTTASSTPTNTNTSTLHALNPNRNSPSRSKTMMMDHATALALQGVLTGDYAPLYAQTLPTLTITPLTSRDKAGPETARAARERTTPLPNNIQLFQQLDDQCDKLQRQINVSLRKASTRQVRPAPIS